MLSSCRAVHRLITKLIAPRLVEDAGRSAYPGLSTEWRALCAVAIRTLRGQTVPTSGSTDGFSVGAFSSLRGAADVQGSAPCLLHQISPDVAKNRYRGFAVRPTTSTSSDLPRSRSAARFISSAGSTARPDGPRVKSAPRIRDGTRTTGTSSCEARRRGSRDSCGTPSCRSRRYKRLRVASRRTRPSARVSQ